MRIFKCFENQSDTYHDTQTHYIMEQYPLLLKDEVDGMDATITADNMEAWKKKDGPSRDRIKSIWLSILHVYDLWESRHNILSYR
jgi:hypothetical protein